MWLRKPHLQLHTAVLDDLPFIIFEENWNRNMKCWIMLLVNYLCFLTMVNICLTSTTSALAFNVVKPGILLHFLQHPAEHSGQIKIGHKCSKSSEFRLKNFKNGSKTRKKFMEFLNYIWPVCYVQAFKKGYLIVFVWPKRAKRAFLMELPFRVFNMSHLSLVCRELQAHTHFMHSRKHQRRPWHSQLV